jgi:hypothetical protein
MLGGPQVSRPPKTLSMLICRPWDRKRFRMAPVCNVDVGDCLTWKQSALMRGDADRRDVRLSTSGRTPTRASLTAGASDPQRAEYSVWLIPNAVLRKCERPRLYVERWRVHICLRPGELDLESWLLQGSCNSFCLTTSVCLAVI